MFMSPGWPIVHLFKESKMDTDEDLTALISMMTEELGRIPTEQEVYDFIFGDEDIRKQILKGSKR